MRVFAVATALSVLLAVAPTFAQAPAQTPPRPDLDPDEGERAAGQTEGVPGRAAEGAVPGQRDERRRQGAGAGRSRAAGQGSPATARRSANGGPERAAAG